MPRECLTPPPLSIRAFKGNNNGKLIKRSRYYGAECRVSVAHLSDVELKGNVRWASIHVPRARQFIVPGSLGVNGGRVGGAGARIITICSGPAEAHNVEESWT